MRGQIVQLALDEPELSPRELATRFTDSKRYFVSEASVYRLLKDHDLIASPAYIVMKAADEFKDKTLAAADLTLRRKCRVRFDAPLLGCGALGVPGRIAM